MSIPANTTADVYHFGNSPPSSPDLAGLAVHLRGAFGERGERGESETATLRYTHILLVPAGTDIRDGYSLGTTGGNFDTVYIPDQNGTVFHVRYVQKGFGLRKVYLDRKQPTWPTDEV